MKRSESKKSTILTSLSNPHHCLIYNEVYDGYYVLGNAINLNEDDLALPLVGARYIQKLKHQNMMCLLFCVLNFFYIFLSLPLDPSHSHFFP